MKKNKLYLLFLLLFFCISQGINAAGEAPKIWGDAGTGNNKDKAYTDGWYKETSSTLTISSDMDLGSLIKALNEKKTFEGKTIELSKDIDMSKYLWATTENPFKGTFNGNGHSIINMKNGAESSPWAFIGVVDQGEINKVVVSGGFTGDKKAGGIAGKLTNGGKILNSAYTGTLASTVDTVKLGGIVGINDGGTVSNCYFTGSVVLTAGTVAGNIAGSSTGAISYSCYLPNGDMALAIGDNAGSAKDVKELSAEAFASGEASWLLNQSGDSNSGIWSTNGTLPVYASEDNKAVYAIRYTDDVSSGGTAVGGPEYVKAGSEVTLTLGVLAGHICTGYTVTGAQVDIQENKFIMPEADLQIAGVYVEFEGPVAKEATEITSSGFTANWEAVTDATDYLLTVIDSEGTVVESYDQVSVGDVTSYVVTNLFPEKEYNYYIQAKMGEIVSKESGRISAKTMKGSTITYSPRITEFKIGNNQVASQTVTVSGNYVTSDIHIALSSNDNFTISDTTLPKEGGELTIDYLATQPGNHEATLTLSTTGAADVKVTLKGSAELAAPVPAVGSTEKYGFTAVWDKVVLAEKYLLTLTQGGIAVPGYENVETTESRYEFKNLNVGQTYSFTVTSVRGESTLVSKPVIVTTKVDYGKQLNNSGFENWHGEGDLAEPVDWHSFMTQNNGFSMADMARVVHMDRADAVRPNSAGKSSTRIWTKQVAIAQANGNLTCGRINAGSMTATDYANHNYTVVGDPDFSETLGGAKPDSLTVWVKFNPKKFADQARVSAIIHDTYKYQDPTNDPTILKHKVAEAIVDINATEDRAWQRLSIPFEYNGESKSADYMLVTFASNKTPGGGSINDSLLVDDILLVYNPEVAITKVDRTAYIQGSKIAVDYTLKGTMSPSNLNAEPNVVTLQMSDLSGSFDHPTILTSVTTDYSGTLVATLPADFPVGKGYRLRIVTTNYPMISQPSADEIEIFEPGSMNISCSKVDDFVVTVGKPTTQTMKVDGFYIDNNVNLSLDNSEQGFSIDKTVLPKEGGNVVVTYLPVAVGKNSAVITLTSVGLDKTVTVNLTGLARPITPVLKASTDIIPTGFTVNWEAVEHATDYELTVTPVGGEPVVKSVGAVTSYTVINLLPVTEYTYSLVAKAGEIASLPTEEGSVTTLSKPWVNVDRNSVDFGTVVANYRMVTQALYITAENLLGDIKAELTGNSNFSVAPEVVPMNSPNKIILVTYNPLDVAANHKAVLTLSTIHGDNLDIQLSGSSVPRATIALPAGEVTSDSFLAKWETVEGATYRLTVMKDGQVLSGYDAVPIRKGNSVTVKELDASTKYTYSVVVVVNSQASEVSNEVAVLTMPLTSIDDVAAGRKVTVYPNPVANDLYVVGENVHKLDVYTVDGMYVATYQVQENKVNVASLPAGTYIFVLTDENGTVARIRIVKE